MKATDVLVFGLEWLQESPSKSAAPFCMRKQNEWISIKQASRKVDGEQLRYQVPGPISFQCHILLYHRIQLSFLSYSITWALSRLLINLHSAPTVTFNSEANDIR